MTALTTEVFQYGTVQRPVQIVEVQHPGPRGLNALDVNLLQIDGGAAATVFDGTPQSVVDGGGA